MIRIFVIMPFAKEFQDIYECIKIALEKIQLTQKIECIRLDDSAKPGVITEELISEITKSQICIADLTGNNPNVLFEVGYALALNKPLILFSQHLDELPFDLKNRKVNSYNRNNFFSEIKTKLEQSIIAVLRNFELSTEDIPEAEIKHNNDIFSIAISGTMQLDKNRCLRRIKSILTPYLGKSILWYVGSFGTADELVADYLCKKNEKVVIVGHHEFDISNKMLEIIHQYKLLYIDTQKEQILKIPNAPSDRDIYMSMKSNLTIFLWDGKSLGIKELTEWYSNNINKDYLVGFC